jgi:hypothetical protein
MKKLYLVMAILLNTSFIEVTFAQAPNQYCPSPNVPASSSEGCMQYSRFICTCTWTGGPPNEPIFSLSPLIFQAPNQEDVVRSAREQMMCFPNTIYSSAAVNCSPE